MADERLLQDMLQMIDAFLKILEQHGERDTIEHRLAQAVFEDINNGRKPYMVNVQYPECVEIKRTGWYSFCSNSD